MVLLTLGLKMYKRIPFGDSGIAETLVGIAISLAYQPIVRRAVNILIFKFNNQQSRSTSRRPK